MSQPIPQPPIPTPPTLAGAQTGRVSPVRVVPGGIFLIDRDTDEVKNIPCALRLVRQREVTRCQDIARQYLASRGDGTVGMTALGALTNLLVFHLSLVAPPVPNARPALLYPGILGPLTDEKGKLVPNAAMLIEGLPLQDAAEGQVDYLADQYDLMKRTECAPAITHEQWEAVVSEGKKLSLVTLISRHGSSVVLQVLHGSPAAAWRE